MKTEKNDETPGVKPGATPTYFGHDHDLENKIR